MKREQYELARELRQQGFSLSEIAKQVGVAKSTISGWVRDIELTDNQKAHLKDIQYANTFMLGAQANHEKALEKRKAQQEVGKEKAKQGSQLHLMGCMLYWAEGAKDRNYVHFTNSDPNMMKLFMRFLREELFINDDAVVIYIHCHTQDEIEQARIAAYWLDLLLLKPANLRKVLYKRGSNSRNNILENGICAVRIYSTELAMHIFGAIQEYGQFDNPDWLF